MLKYVLLASAMTLAAPALAQDGAPTSDTQQTTSSKAKKSKDSTMGQPAQPGVTTTTNDSAPVSSAAAPMPSSEAAPMTPDATATPQTTTPQPASPQTADAATDQGAQVASILDSEFPGYDADKSGSLNKKEFASWMDALKTKSDPAAKPDATWNDAAFKQADKDKSKSVTKEELAGFLNSAAPAA